MLIATSGTDMNTMFIESEFDSSNRNCQIEYVELIEGQEFFDFGDLGGGAFVVGLRAGLPLGEYAYTLEGGAEGGAVN
jgi:hypothetical protein